jgi:UDP-GlcNAc3NAcA epimerase
MKILTVVGARPQFIKAAVVSRYLRQHSTSIQEEIIHTGQHYDHGMSQVFFDEMNIPKPTVNLQIGSGTHGAVTGDMLKNLELEMLSRKPDYVLVYGDTNSTLAGALAAAKLHIPIAHIEAGERSYNRQMPEEINRILTDHMSSLLFCCSEASEKRLAKEGISTQVFNVGDVMYDAFFTYLPHAIWPKNLTAPTGSFALATLHRAQNTDDPARLSSIFAALSALDEQVILPIHPRTRKHLEAYSINIGKNIHLIEPVSYFEMLALLKECAYVLTDSGGLQKEAYYANKKCIILREETEWVELVNAGMNAIAGVDKTKIIEMASWAKEMAHFPEYIYGDGNAAKKIIEHLERGRNFL